MYPPIMYSYNLFETEIEKLRNENDRLQTELVNMKRKIEDLEGNIRQVEEDNSLLRELNDIFGVESDKLNEENKDLRKELERYRQFRIPQSLTNPTQTDRPNKRLKKSKEKSPEEPNEIAARVRIVLQISLQSNLCIHKLLLLFIFAI